MCNPASSLDNPPSRAAESQHERYCHALSHARGRIVRRGMTQEEISDFMYAIEHGAKNKFGLATPIFQLPSPARTPVHDLRTVH
jgi:hypothetical protein